MTIICASCNYENALGTEFCEACGSELQAAYNDLSDTKFPKFDPILPDSDEVIKIHPPRLQPALSTAPNLISTANNISNPIISASTARLISKQVGSPIQEFFLDGSSAIVGRFDPDSGPVDIDLEAFPGDNTVSRHHAEIYYDGGQWKVKDLGSMNHVFIKHFGQSRFGAMITMPETLNSGDEIAFGKIRFLFQSP